MGEVWLAQDSRLGRKVAIKVLPPEFAGDPERLARFEQEARAAAALNHPHIAAVHDVGFEDGTHFIVQEWLQGKSLRDVIGGGRVAMDKALALGTEIAEALSAAHRAGIVHRDLKPENIFVTEQGHAKVLDFGLAKLTEMATGAMSSQSMSPTVLGTQAGTVMGSAGYMAPEQVQGEEVDQRADLFTFGCVLYELVSGRRAFAGETVLDSLHAITRTEPDALSDVAANLPVDLGRIVAKCLQKDADRRYQHADDLAVDLRAIAADVEAGRAAIAGLPAVSEPAAARPGAISPAVAVPAALLLMALAAAAAWTFKGVEPGAVRRFEIALAAGETMESRIGARLLTVSPDGEQVVYAASRGASARLYRRQLSSSVAVEIPGTEGGIVPFFSPDSEWLAFYSGNRMYKVPIAGGERVSLTEVQNGWEWATWTDRDEIIFTRMLTGLWRMPAGGGAPTLLAAPRADQGERGYFSPDVIPGTQDLVFVVFRGAGEFELAALETATGAVHLLGQAGMAPIATTGGQLLFTRDGQLWAMSFDAEAFALRGSPLPVVQNLLGRGGTQLAISDAGVLVYLAALDQAEASSRVTVVDRVGNVEQEVLAQGLLRSPSLSPDGTRVAVTLDGDVWILELGEGGSRRRWTFDGGNTGPVWSRDGANLVFSGPMGELRQKTTDDSLAAMEVLYKGNDFVNFGGWTADGEMVVGELGDSWDIQVIDAAGESRPLVATGFQESSPRTSPDGRWVAYESNQSGVLEVYLRTVAGDTEMQISTAFGRDPRWSADGAEIFYRDETNQLQAVRLELDADPRILEREHLFDLRGRGGYAVDPTGGRFLLIDRKGAEIRTINVVLNWFEELNLVVPTGGGAR